MEEMVVMNIFGHLLLGELNPIEIVARLPIVVLGMHYIMTVSLHLLEMITFNHNLQMSCHTYLLHLYVHVGDACRWSELKVC